MAAVPVAANSSGGATVEKIPTMFERDETARGRPVTPALKPECQWVAAGEGVATRKLDGMNVKVGGGVLHKRQKPTEGVYDEASYVPASRDEPGDRYLFDAFDSAANWEDGIYEALGPKIQGNPEKYERHTLVRVVPAETCLVLTDVPRTFGGLREWLAAHDVEGIVFHHEDGRKAKIKKRDFGLKR
jgi:hypothetical protein